MVPDLYSPLKIPQKPLDSNPFNLNFSVIPWREKLQQIMVYKEQSKSITSHNLLIPLLKFCCHMLYCEAGKV